MGNGRVGRVAVAVWAVVMVTGAVGGCGGASGAGAAGKPHAGGTSARPAVSGSASVGATTKAGTPLYPLPTGTPASRGGPASRNSSRLVSQEEIDSYVLTKKDVPGYEVGAYEGRAPDGTELPVYLSSGNLPRVFPASCQHVYENAVKGSAYRQYARAVFPVMDGPGHPVDAALIAYRPADAPRVLADLRAALPRCTAYTSPGDMNEGFEHPQALPDPHLGDEAVEFGITEKISDEDGTNTHHAPFHFTVVRKGSVIAWFMAHTVPDTPIPLPMDVINAQLAKLP